MVDHEDQITLRFETLHYGLSWQRLWEHIHLGQINPFTPLSPRSADDPRGYIDVVDISDLTDTLTGITVAGLIAGTHGEIPREIARQLLAGLDSAGTRKWMAAVAEQMRQFALMRATRNKPESFLPFDQSSPLRLAGIHCALSDWLMAHRQDKASAAQWQGRVENLANKGLRDEEIAFSGLFERMADQDAAFTGADLSGLLNYNAVRLRIVPVIRSASGQLDFVRVPPNASIKRIKPKLKAALATYPQWRDRVMGYWVDAVEWSDLLGKQRNWMAFTHRGQALVSKRHPSGLCSTIHEAQALANDDAKKVLPKLTARGKWTRYRLTGGDQYREWLVTLPFYPPSYFSGHFEHRNVLLHIRCDVRESAEGERVLVLQEVQSDWAQEARRADQEIDADPPPPVPWQKEWAALAIKLMLLHSAARQASALAWTPGKIQVNRWKGRGKAGLIHLYDRTLPAEANRLLRPFGRKCEPIEVYVPANFFIEPTETGYEVFDHAGKSKGRAASMEEAQALLPDGAEEVLMPMHGVRLDAELRQRITATGFCAWGEQIR